MHDYFCSVPTQVLRVTTLARSVFWLFWYNNHLTCRGCWPSSPYTILFGVRPATWRNRWQRKTCMFSVGLLSFTFTRTALHFTWVQQKGLEICIKYIEKGVASHLFGQLHSLKTWLCVCVCMHVCACMCVCLYACVCLHACVCACMYACICVCACMRVCAHACMCVHACMHVCVCMHACVRVCVCERGREIEMIYCLHMLETVNSLREGEALLLQLRLFLIHHFCFCLTVVLSPKCVHISFPAWRHVIGGVSPLPQFSQPYSTDCCFVQLYICLQFTFKCFFCVFCFGFSTSWYSSSFSLFFFNLVSIN